MFRKIIESEIEGARSSGRTTGELVARRALNGLDKMEREGTFIDPVNPDVDFSSFINRFSEISKVNNDVLVGSLGTNATARIKYYFRENPGKIITKEELIQFAYSGHEGIPTSAYTSLGSMIRRAKKSLVDEGKIVFISKEGYLFDKKN